jgi:hypothetical protein
LSTRAWLIDFLEHFTFESVNALTLHFVQRATTWRGFSRALAVATKEATDKDSNWLIERAAC